MRSATSVHERQAAAVIEAAALISSQFDGDGDIDATVMGLDERRVAAVVAAANVRLLRHEAPHAVQCASFTNHTAHLERAAHLPPRFAYGVPLSRVVLPDTWCGSPPLGSRLTEDRRSPTRRARTGARRFRLPRKALQAGFGCARVALTQW